MQDYFVFRDHVEDSVALNLRCQVKHPLSQLSVPAKLAFLALGGFDPDVLSQIGPPVEDGLHPKGEPEKGIPAPWLDHWKAAIIKTHKYAESLEQ